MTSALRCLTSVKSCGVSGLQRSLVQPPHNLGSQFGYVSQTDRFNVGRAPPFRYFGLTCSDVTSSVIVGLHLVQSSY